MRKVFPTEAKVGIFVIITVAALVYLSVRITRAGFSLDKTKTLYVNFANASGILQRTPVEFAGIRVGFVKKIELVERKARLELELDPRVPVYQDTRVAMSARGILGEKIIVISGGGNLPEVPDGGLIDAAGGGGTFEDAMNNFNEIADAVKDLIRGGEGKPSLKDVVVNMSDITEDLRTLIRGNRKNMEDIVNNVNRFTTMLNDGDLKDIISNLKYSSETLKTFVHDANPQLKDVVKDFKGVMTKIDNTVDSLNRVMARVERGEGTLGKLLSDDTTVNKVNDTLDGINDFVGRAKRLEVAVGFSGEFLSSAHEVQSTASFRLQPNYDKYFLIEFTKGPFETLSATRKDIENTTGGTTTTTSRRTKEDKFTFTAIMARRFYDLTLKAGLMRSTAGIGLEYHLFRNHFSLGVDAFDFGRDENPHIRAFAALHLFKILHITGGVDDAFHEYKRRNFFGGLGIMLTDNDLKALLGVAPLIRN